MLVGFYQVFREVLDLLHSPHFIFLQWQPDHVKIFIQVCDLNKRRISDIFTCIIANFCFDFKHFSPTNIIHLNKYAKCKILIRFFKVENSKYNACYRKTNCRKKLQTIVQIYQTFLKILVNILFRILQYALF